MRDKKMKANMDACIADIKNDRKETTACQDAMEANLEEMNASHKEMLAKMEAERKADLEILRSMMERMTNANLAKTDVKLKELTETIQKTHVECEEPTSADMNACQDAMEANLVKMEPNPGEKEAAVEWQETPNEEVAIYSLREC
jgi:hypothetical protein